MVGQIGWFAGDSARVYVVDNSERAVLAVDPRHGSLLWRYDKHGSGPGELRRPGIMYPVGGNRGVAVFDRSNGRMTILNPDGAHVRDVPVHDLAGAVMGLCALNSLQWLVVTVRSDSLLVLDSEGRVVEKRPPWQGFLSLGGDLSGSLIADADGRCVSALSLAYGFAVLDSSGYWHKVPYVESTAVPTIVRAATGASLKPPGVAVRSVVATRDTTFLLFQGQTGLQKRLIDLYSTVSGTYIGTRILPFRAADFVYAGSGLYVVLHLGPDSLHRLTALRPK